MQERKKLGKNDLSVKKTSIRKAYGEVLVEIGEDNKDIFSLEADLGGVTYSCMFGKKFPERYINVGDAEQNLIGTAAGLAATGKIPYASTFAVFASMRAAEQVRFAVAYNNLKVRIIGMYSGLNAGRNGPSHHCEGDIAVMRSIPNMTVIEPADSLTLKKLIKESVNYDGPIYIRIGRKEVPLIYSNSDRIKIGKANILREGKDLTIIACGLMVYESLIAAEKLEEDEISAEVIDLHTIKPLDSETILNSVKKTNKVITVEEHNIFGGLGSTIAELLSVKFPTKMNIIGIEDIFTDSDEEEILREKYGLTSDNIYKKAIKMIND